MSAPDFFSSKRVEAGRAAYECHMCRGAIPLGSVQIAISQRVAGKILGYRLHVECAELAGVMPRPAEVATFSAVSSAPAADRIFSDHG